MGWGPFWTIVPCAAVSAKWVCVFNCYHFWRNYVDKCIYKSNNGVCTVFQEGDLNEIIFVECLICGLVEWTSSIKVNSRTCLLTQVVTFQLKNNKI